MITPGTRLILPLRLGLFAVYLALLPWTSQVWLKTGDEPHYLVAAASLARDGDFDLRNNYDPAVYLDWYTANNLTPHVKTRADGAEFLIHTYGLPLLIAPAYWLAGVRASLPQQILFNLPYIAAVPLLVGIPAWGILALTLEGVVRNNWMHMNVVWRSNWIERVFVTPRYHHIHHSADAQLHDGNYGSLFSIWDRLFGTYLDPDTTVPRTFGTGEKKRDPVLLMIGL